MNVLLVCAHSMCGWTWQFYCRGYGRMNQHTMYLISCLYSDFGALWIGDHTASDLNKHFQPSRVCAGEYAHWSLSSCSGLSTYWSAGLERGPEWLAQALSGMLRSWTSCQSCLWVNPDNIVGILSEPGMALAHWWLILAHRRALL